MERTRVEQIEDGIEERTEEQAEPRTGRPAHRRVRVGELYYVEDEAAPSGWSIVEIAGLEGDEMAAFAPGQLEAIPLAELDGRILGPVVEPGCAQRAA